MVLTQADKASKEPHTKEVTKMRLDPTIITEAMDRTGCRSIDELGWKFLNKTGTTVRNYRDGKSVPTIPTLMILKRITNRPLDSMILEDQAHAA